MIKGELKGKVVPVKMWAPINEVESEALDQLKNVASLPVVVHHVAVMPDVHAGHGCTVGSVIATKGAVSPACVGVDIGCGMCAVKTNLTLGKIEKKVKEIRHQIERDIPVGFNSHKSLDHHKRLPLSLKNQIDKLYREFPNLDSHVQKLLDKSMSQLGTLGGGNHFIELCIDSDNTIWLMLHSGSRNIGKELAEVHISQAMKLEHNHGLPDKSLAYFLSNTAEMQAYRRDLYWAQTYARLNRDVMLELAKLALEKFYPSVKFEEAINCHHNYVSEEHHFGDDVFVTRKGAIYAGVGAMGIIPGSMGTKSYIVRGKGNPDSFNSASHGAGRKMSRGKAKKMFTKQDLEEQTKGVDCRKDEGVIDEIPAAYKKIEKVMANQDDLVEIVAEIKQIMCIKG